ncbi:M48 family metallopeptidase [Sinimarinibacterium sp. CAU 1509]|uniref:M48 family metallopeptidase n=1 Tax=Sinimarinibacterium sp. CAU 1509 TaxID=2562283 RepID=UPI0010AD8689|nr:M48 family metallopeptidase [Sinimarinibacterium sp. CAU 1509]TJY64766.1 M48 family metallopeptidase [Sinimarinibacterium sp. CAU 1509]
MSRWPAVRTLLCIAVVGAVVTACVTSPTGRRQLRLVSDAEMAQMGVTAFQDLKEKTPPTKDGKTNRYVQCVANAITREVGGQWEVQVFDSKQVNAFALPGGKIGVYTGLLKVTQNQDQLAAVIGHEVSHVLAGHSAARVSNEMATQLGVAVVSSATGVSGDMIGMGANLLLLLPYSRGDESEADVLGQQLMARAGFDPAEASKLWENMARAGGETPPEFASTHPSPSTRISDLNKNLSKVIPLYNQARAAGKKPSC